MSVDILIKRRTSSEPVEFLPSVLVYIHLKTSAMHKFDLFQIQLRNKQVVAAVVLQGIRRRQNRRLEQMM
jgi:hypothetical protein